VLQRDGTIEYYKDKDHKNKKVINLNSKSLVTRTGKDKFELQAKDRTL
jgi:hypothetical protein